MSGERPLLPGETCRCGRPAVTVFLADHGDVPWCGIPDGGARPAEQRPGTGRGDPPIEEDTMTVADTSLRAEEHGHRIVRADVTDPVWDEVRGVVIMPRTYSDDQVGAAMVALVRERSGL